MAFLTIRATSYFLVVLCAIQPQSIIKTFTNVESLKSVPYSSDNDESPTPSVQMELPSAVDMEGRSLKKSKIKDRFITSCTEFKQVIMEGPSIKYKLNFDDVCFSISKLPHCRSDCKEQRNVKVTYRFACFNTEDAAVQIQVEGMVEKLRQGIFLDLAKEPLRKLKVKYPTGCKPRA